MRVFILGAGFSKPAGMPLATELTTKLIQHFRGILRDEQADMLQWINGLADHLTWFQPSGSAAINVEELFHYAEYEIEAARLRQHLVTVGREDGETPWQAGEDIRTWLAHLEQALVEVIWKAQLAADLHRLHVWAEAVQPDDRVITFNYDTLVEDALSHRGVDWTHGFATEPHGLPILKVHGSVDWVLIERDSHNPDVSELLFHKENTNVDREVNGRPVGAVEDDYDLVRVRDKETLDKAIENQVLNSRFFGLAGLGTYKSLHTVPGLGCIWSKACRALYEADEIVVVGFSLSPFDGMARYHFGSTMKARQEQPRDMPRLTIVDPRASDLKPQFEAVFGTAHAIGCAHESIVDWNEPAAS